MAVDLQLAGGIGYGGDLALTPTGDLLKVVDTPGNPAATIQVLTRIILTNPMLTNSAGQNVARPDDLFNPWFGSGVRALVGEPVTPNLVGSIQARILKAISSYPGIRSNPSPVVNVFTDGQNDGQVYVSVQCTTVTGEIVTIPSLALQIFAPSAAI